jgi:ABC-type transporter Mla maintaining outer membrane lipid asymmetry ATPase subunit MlaF
MTNPQPVPASDSASATVPAVDIENVVCQFGKVVALGGVSLKILPGTVVGVVGPTAPARQLSSM